MSDTETSSSADITEPKSSAPELPAAYRLLGTEIENGWYVAEPMNWRLDKLTGLPARDPYGSGGHFSVGYIVTKGNTRAFLKAINLAFIIDEPDILEAMKEVTDSVQFEREIHRVCGEQRLDRVIQAVGSGEIRLGKNLQDRVPYLILELADGDVRRRVRAVDQSLQFAWKMRAMHHAAVGLSQIHSRKIAHQDLKPSNVMSFDTIEIFKIGDFGRSAMAGLTPPHEEYAIAGDLSYAPPELLYGQIDPDWSIRRLGCDVYLLGSLLVCLLLGQGCTSLLMRKLQNVHRPIAFRGLWQGPYAAAIPAVRMAFSEVLEELAAVVPPNFRDEIVSAVTQLCDPDPSLRGHPIARAQRNVNSFELSRYISLFDTLARRAQIEARGAN